jgi:hypothetical protein
MSTTAILLGLEDNCFGQLFSIDAPNLDPLVMLPEGRAPGWLVPQRLGARWHLQLGLSSSLLPPLLETLPPIDVFIHDSEHSYENMSFEYRIAFQHLAAGGILLSDDTSWNSAFSDFVSEHGLRNSWTIRHPNVRAVRKVVL